ncbi:MAG: tetratricopeptide repeat protein [Prevotellaceae bacterium]|jgi:tetratricopeptide (TPR) repeat protein|nr:tetratricopeptide repeat protein [Prevotellaceae bacterium]
MKKLILYMVIMSCSSFAIARQRSIVSDYKYTASEADSKITSRVIATQQVRNELLDKVVQSLQVDKVFKEETVGISAEEFSGRMKAIIAGILEMNIIEEKWDGITYYMKAEVKMNLEETIQKIRKILVDRRKTRELEFVRNRVLDAQAEINKLKKELLSLGKPKEDTEAITIETSTELQKSYKVQTDKLTVEDFLTKAYNAFEKQQYKIAVENYQKAINLDPTNEGAYNNLGNVYHVQGKYNQALEMYQKAIELRPDYANAYYNLGIVYDDMGYYLLAIDAYIRALRLEPESPEIYNNMGISYDRQGNYAEAIKSYKKVIELKPDYAEVYDNMGLAYYAQGEYALAIEAFNKTLEYKPYNAGTYFIIGLAYYAQNDFPTAIQNYQKAVEINPDADAYNNMGWAYEKHGNMQQAMRAYEKALRLNPEHVQAHHSMGNIYSRMGEYNMAIKEYKKVLKIFPNNSQVYYDMGTVYAKMGNTKQAVKSFQKAAEIGHKQAQEMLSRAGYTWRK